MPVTSSQSSQPITDASADTIADIGELALIERLKPFCAEGSIGDDAALMPTRAGHQMVVTTDMLSENVHFSDRTTPPYAVGWRAAAANLSDLAAMGARPLGITVGLGLPKNTRLSWVEALYQGMSDCLKAHGGVIVGGDLCRARQRTVSITAVGEVLPSQAIRRRSAIPGMTVVVTGPHGASRAGLALLLGELTLLPGYRSSGHRFPEHCDYDSARDSVCDSTWIRAHQMPIPRFDAVEALRGLISTIGSTHPELASSDSLASPYPTVAGMDSSDGLANALLQISESAQVGMDIVSADIPLPAGLSEAVGAQTALEWALYGGEDFELVLCLPAAIAQPFIKTKFATAIGQTTDSGMVQLLPEANSTKGLPLTYGSYKHF
ncbi:MAG: thiamine-phosphate kinase [Phormidesmis sp.]